MDRKTPKVNVNKMGLKKHLNDRDNNVSSYFWELYSIPFMYGISSCKYYLSRLRWVACIRICGLRKASCKRREMDFLGFSCILSRTAAMFFADLAFHRCIGVSSLITQLVDSNLSTALRIVFSNRTPILIK